MCEASVSVRRITDGRRADSARFIRWSEAGAPRQSCKEARQGVVSVTVGHPGRNEPRCFPMAFPPPTPGKAGNRKRETLAASPQSQPCVKRQFLPVPDPGSIEYRENRTIDCREHAHHQPLRPSRRRNAGRGRCGPSGARCRRLPSSRHSPKPPRILPDFPPSLGTRNPWRRHTLRRSRHAGCA